jgi:formiminoglutamate deiminase
MARLWFEQALLPTGWATDVRITIAADTITNVETGVAATRSDTRHAVGIPGLPNLHSHAFQRAMAGRAEVPGSGGQDDFWRWRDRMYQLVGTITPDDCSAIAAMAFVEMLEAGFTRVGEFHYLHHNPDGTPYADRSEMAVAIASAAADTGIALTLLPVFYAHSGFGGLAPRPEQRRFVNDLDGFAALLEGSQRAVRDVAGAVLGIAPHSLRAVTADQLQRLLELAPDGPIHIHVAEQVAEVAACLAWSGQRPVQWLIAHAPVDARWCLVHATHIDADELQAIVRAQAVVGLCPITEANLGDGLFPADAFQRAGGRWGIGSDSNIRIDAAEEMRLLEYGQRLVLRRRNVLARTDHSTGRSLFAAGFAGGTAALGSVTAGLAEGEFADIVALAPGVTSGGDQCLDDWIFANGRVETVWRAGRIVVAEGRHVARDAVAARFYGTCRRLR